MGGEAIVIDKNDEFKNKISKEKKYYILMSKSKLKNY